MALNCTGELLLYHFKSTLSSSSTGIEITCTYVLFSLYLVIKFISA